jgi:hypothetical protein
MASRETVEGSLLRGNTMSDNVPQPPNPAAIGQQFLANGNQPVEGDNVPPVAPSPQNGQGPSSQPVPTATPVASPASQVDNAAGAQTAKHAAIGRFFTGLVSGGSGSSTSQLWRTVVGSAILGLGAGGSDPVVTQGPYGAVRDRSIGGAASRGFQAGQGYLQQEQDRQHQLEQQGRDAAQKDQQMKIELDDLALRKAADARAQQQSIQNSVEHEKRMAMLDQSIARGNWEATQRAVETAEQQVNFFNALQEVHADALTDSEGQPLQFATHIEAEKAAHDNPKFFIGNFQTRTAYNPEAQKYEIYRVPDTDIKNVQLKDPVSGQIHTIQRMHVSDYLDFLTRVQNLKKGQLSTEEAALTLNRLQSQIHDEDLYGSALNGDLDYSKLGNRDRANLYARAAKDSQEAIRSRSTALARLAKLNSTGLADQDELNDAKEQLQEASELGKTYAGVLSRLHGNPTPNPNQITPTVQRAIDAISHLPKAQQATQIDGSSLTPEEKQTVKKNLGLK